MGSGCGVMKRFSLMSNVYTKRNPNLITLLFSFPLALPRVTSLLRNMIEDLEWDWSGRRKGGRRK
jgi:hypothetical protein